jgi:hypothetical protein
VVHKLKNKTFIELHGIKKAKEIGKKISDKKKGCKRPDLSKWNKDNLTGKTYEELYGIRRAKKLRGQIKNTLNGKYVGKNSFNWHGGVSFIDYPAEFNDDLREAIRKRDNYKCRLCLKTREECFLDTRKDLCIHHRDYDKKNNNEDNLISLCNTCHLKTNFNREYWKEVFNGICVRAIIVN